MSEAQNVENVKALYAAYARGDIAAVTDGLAPDVEWRQVSPVSFPTGGLKRGPQEVVEKFFARVREVADVVAFNIDQILASGETVVVLGHGRFRTKRTGEEWGVEFAHAMRMRDGRIAHFREFTDTALLKEKSGW
ncbi:MAG: nuclear transport factor 2 family protein [Rhodospirillales bacterium]